VEVRLWIRRFRCDTTACTHQTFAESWPTWLDARVQRSIPLKNVQSSVAMAVGGEAGHRLLGLLHEQTSADTLLRLIRAQAVPERPPPRVLGVDDFCFRRRQTYGTLLIDLERHHVVDVLPDRQEATLATWLTAHPGIEIISRDRAGDYARGAASGAPNAQQIADRFHLLKNLRDTSESFLKRFRAHLISPTPQSVSATAAPGMSLPTRPAQPNQPSQNATVRRLTKVLDRRAQRLARYERAMALSAEGCSIRAIAGLTGTSRTVISGRVKLGHFPGRMSVLSKITPYADVVRARVLSQEFTGLQIIEDVRALGYTGSHNGVYELMRWLSVGHLTPSLEDQQGTVSTAPAVKRYSTKQGAWLFVQPPDALKERDHTRLTHLQDAIPESKTVYTLVQTFVCLLRTQPHDAVSQLTNWLVSAKSSAVIELERFARGVQKDLSAIIGAMTSPWSNGQVEGQVTRVKLLKRQMYGRAKFDLLRTRILLASRAFPASCTRLAGEPPLAGLHQRMHWACRFRVVEVKRL